ncbi:cell wall-binding repeat-containing protein [Clostridium sp. HV4-5-A1G]|uniref:cell wall-binding repeat-containing protein n=1 Tax=Clostridium sp. HV4-5-A1G TaxID=2004595 RepID=UPI0022A7BE5B|nr:cell wall-binding repeat-containing protein [Clostridium sp. HV4-5-A1G]
MSSEHGLLWDHYETSLNIAKQFGMDSDTVTFASGSGFADALSDYALSAQKNAPLILVNNVDVAKQKEYTDSSKYTKELVYGGAGVIPDSAVSLLSKSQYTKLQFTTRSYQLDVSASGFDYNPGYK